MSVRGRARMSELPNRVEELTADWMAEALGIPVTNVEVTEVIWGTATKVRLAVTSVESAGPATRDVCVKGALGERFDVDMGPQSPYALEARFYAEVAPNLSCGLPAALFAAADERGQGIVVLPDLSVAGGRFGDPLSPLTPDQVAQALEVEAGWHSVPWAQPSLSLDSFPGFSASRLAGELLLSTDMWEQHFALDTSPALPDSLRDRERVLTAFRRLWEFEDGCEPTLVHGDAHLGNIYIDPDGLVSFLDWQGVCLGALTLDVAYFLVGALNVTDRRRHEVALLDHYREALAAAGGPKLDRNSLLRAYRQHCLHGLLWAVTPSWMQPPELCNAMTERYVAAVEDQETLELLLGPDNFR
jgi:aminoglycoside phosphotransferase (APT) family kinase protein